MARVAKTPLYNGFNAAKNCFGEKTDNGFAWQSYLRSNKPLTLELGCGKAELTMGLARLYPNMNFLGIDLKADRLWRPAKKSLEDNLQNTAFMQTNILSIAEYIHPATVDTVWITFPDPFPKKRQAKHRMLNRNFLDLYKLLLKENGVIRFKTDNQALFYWALELLATQNDINFDELSFDLHASDLPDEYKIITTYEQKFLDANQPIYYVQWHFR